MSKFAEFDVLLHEMLEAQTLLSASLSKLRTKDSPVKRISIRPVKLKGDLLYQFTYHHAQKELHDNLPSNDAVREILELMKTTFRQGHFLTAEADWQVLVSKRGALKVLKHRPSRPRQQVDLAHDRQKQYLLEEGYPYPFLVELGVMNQAGKVLAKRYHKFRQLNKYLEIIEDCLPYLQHPKSDQPLRIVDFGSGKAYLTFALYHYLVEHLNLNVDIIGLDLKEDVVEFCNGMAKTLGYDALRFVHQDIRDFQADGSVDMVVSLHACDVATDYALAQAVKWQARIILAVPCCQHEVLGQLAQEVQPVLFEHGILKERVAAIVTDAARAKLLEAEGYAVKVMEFIDLEHTAKNLLIRAFRQAEPQAARAQAEYARFKQDWGIAPSLERLLADQ